MYKYIQTFSRSLSTESLVALTLSGKLSYGEENGISLDSYIKDGLKIEYLFVNLESTNTYNS